MTTPLLKKPWNPIRNQRGSYFAMSALALLVIFGFAALGVEAGRWYAVQGELSKSIDGAAFAGAQNVNNPNIPDLHLFVEQVARANFADGLLGTDTAVFVSVTTGMGRSRLMVRPTPSTLWRKGLIPNMTRPMWQPRAQPGSETQRSPSC